MASSEGNVCLVNAEDNSQGLSDENSNMNSKPDSNLSNGDSIDIKDTKQMKQDQKLCDDSAPECSNNANVGNTISNKETTKLDGDKKCEAQITDDTATGESETVQNNYSHGQVNCSFESDSDDGFCVLRRSRSDELLELKHHFQAKECSEALQDYPSPVSEINAKEYLQIQKEYACSAAAECGSDITSPGRAGYSYNPYNPCSDSPESSPRRRRRQSSGSSCEERVRSIEEEYIQRIGSLEERHFELEDCLARLTSSLEPIFESSAADDFRSGDVAGAYEACIDEDPDYPEDHAEEKAKIDELLRKTEQQKKRFARMIGFELFIEFQQKIRNFAIELNGVLNCSEAAIRHARVVQEWGTSVQLMFEEMKEERMKMQDFIDDRERNFIILRNQFASELQTQGNILRDIVDDMKTYRDLYDAAEKYGGAVSPRVSQGHLAKNIVDLLLRQRLEGDKALILDLKKQSKISEQKLIIIHQQSFIQQIQEQNRELRAIIEGLMGAEEMYFETPPSGTPCSASSPERGSPRKPSTSSTPGGTPGSMSSPERASYRKFCSPDRSSARQSLDKLLDKSLDSPVCKISDVLDCDRGEIYPGISTDGDIATIQTFDVGKGGKSIVTDPTKQTVYDPLSVSFIRDQCRAVEESERRHAMQQQGEDTENVEYTEEGIPTFRDGVEAVNIEPYLRKTAEQKAKSSPVDNPESKKETEPFIPRDKEAGGDGSDREAKCDVGIGISTKVSYKGKEIDILAEYDDGEDDDDDDEGEEVDVSDILVDGVVADIAVAEPPIIDIENTNNNDD